MPVEITSRCLRCKRELHHSDFPLMHVTTNPFTKKLRRVYDGYCKDCQPFVTPAMRKADLRDSPKRDAPDR